MSDEDKTQHKDSFIITHNLKGNSIQQWVDQFKANEAHRKHKRTDSVYLTHEILSWNDNKNLTPEMMEAMTREYMRLRNPKGMYVAVPHFDKQYHVHICASGIEYKTGKSMRLSKASLQKLKKDIQDYQVERFPGLVNSVVKHGNGGKSLMTDAELQLKRRTKGLTDKELVKQKLEIIFKNASSKDEFFQLLNNGGLKTYERGGSIYGVCFGTKKHRFKTIGFSPERLESLNKALNREKELKDLRGKAKDRNIIRSK